MVYRHLSLCTSSVALLQNWGEKYPKAPGLGLGLSTNPWAQAVNYTMAFSSSAHWVEGPKRLVLGYPRTPPPRPAHSG